MMQTSERFRWSAWLAAFVFVPVAFAATPCNECAAQTPETTKPEAAKPEPTTELVIVVGAPGTEEYGEQFESDAKSWRKLAQERKWSIVELNSAPTTEKVTQTNNASLNQHDQLRTALSQSIERQTKSLWLVLIGHGTSERGSHKFNLVGPDMTARELNDWLKPFTGSLVVVNCSSASAPFIPEMSGANRVVITATRSGSENNYSRFGAQLAASLLDPTSDMDHDDEVSLLEAFLIASAKTEKFYREQSRLATEHALIDDNGDKLGTGAEFFQGTKPNKSPQPGKKIDGALAAKITLANLPGGVVLNEAQTARRSEIEDAIEALKNRKPNPPTEAYWSELEQLAKQMAQLYSEASAK